MASWPDVLDDPRSIQAIYDDRTPPLESVVLHEISLHRDGPRVVLRFDLPEYPTHPPKKWLNQGLNVVQIQLMLIGIRDLSLRGWSHESSVNLSLERQGDAVRVAASSGSTTINISAEAASIVSVSAYLSPGLR
ncbi:MULTISPECIES: Imm50 family immunity protein [Protofrankia]|uniref:Imm50 family immunity protein n=1 Tax=Protofrankia TaxID=2994361 RepID=UPI000977ED7F|nr:MULTISPECIES: Imm50 family immunity protein [Protofrankia]